MVKCTDCGIEILENQVVYCQMCGNPLCQECETTGLCSTCTELWELEIDLEDIEAAEEE
jgi:hypothetical protein